MSITSASAKDIARLGGNITLTADCGYTSASVKDIIRIAVSAGGSVTVNASSYTSASLKDFVRIGKNRVTIEL